MLSVYNATKVKRVIKAATWKCDDPLLSNPGHDSLSGPKTAECLENNIKSTVL